MFSSKMLKTLRVQIALHYLAASALTLLLMGFILYYSISSVVLNEAVTTTETAVDKSGMYIDLYIDRLRAVSSLLAENPQLVSYLSNTKRDPLVKKDINTTIDTTISSDSFIKSVIIVSKDGQILSNESNLNMSMSNDMMKEQWYTSAVHSGSMPVLTSARMQQFSMDKDSWVISISREIKNTQGENIGVLLIDIEYKVIEDYLANLDLGKTGFSFIINDNSEVVYHMDPAYFKDNTKQNTLRDIVANKDNYDSKQNTLTHTYHLKNADWLLVGVYSQDGLLAIKKQLLDIFLLVGIVLQIIAASSVGLFAGRITAPFQKLEKAMAEIETGLSEVVIDEKGCYEAQSLAKHFNIMIHKIDKLMQEITEKEKHLRSSEMSALHSQINPHFLYNTLDTIVWMAEFNNSEKVIEITKALAQFFRLSLSGGQELTTVENELNHVRQYLFIQKERYGDQLAYEIICDATLSQIQLPKILLQPIVENALYHGIRAVTRQGLIEIHAKEKGNDILFIVKDNGQGFDMTQMDHNGSTKMTKLGGVGIKNVDQRIKLYYGDTYGIAIDSIIGSGTTVTIKIPWD
ncbi:sensor histidine kinase [Sporosarcina limicola]|uniref:Two-component system sensor histidine kinase YesM n=1 Tax=Sporosarcina limicola TaxID=34101 RepID=A0A927MK75_9BACL|nr:sensor histidine kinase [Sporosarcina limicola]MBE1554662.1 two-component system sensor histidine kinase YesM [Sporosarcina limicola]